MHEFLVLTSTTTRSPFSLVVTYKPHHALLTPPFLVFLLYPQEMMREFLEREKRKQAEREAAKAEKQAAQQAA
jgi:hypothetical protein